MNFVKLVTLLAVMLPLSSAVAAQKTLAPGHVPVAVAQKKVSALGRLAATNELHLALAMPLRDAAGLTNFLRDLYNPASPQFRHYLTPQEFTARFGPTPDELAAVVKFANDSGFKIMKTHPNRLLVDVTAKAPDVERAFHLQLNSFKHPKEKRNFFAPDTEPSVDAALPLLHVSGLDNFSLPHPQVHPQTVTPAAAPRGGSGPFGAYIGEDFRKAYIPGTPLVGAGQNVALLQFDGFYDTDITNYETLIGLTNTAPSLIVVPVDGGVTTPGGGEIEVALDIEMLLSMSPGISNIYVYEAPNPSPWVDLLSQIANDNAASQIGCSWGGGGPDPASEIIFQQMAAQGQSFFNATGDSDALIGGIQFPSDSPNITEVGGTTLTTDGNGDYVSETVWNWGYIPSAQQSVGGSGGSSTVVPVPSWQIGLDTAANQAAPLLRNLPDVALTADNVFIMFGNGTNGFVGGTSCAAPLWAGFTALVNEQAAQSSQPPVGFLNPAIYAISRGANYSTAFHDTTDGNNTNDYSSNQFFATPGYDLCTGWGTPNGTNLINALLAPDFLGVSPQTVFTSSGLVGGPFSATNWTVTLTNAGAASLNWSCAPLPAWLAASALSGTLPAGGSATINLQLAGAEQLPPNNYVAVLAVTNQTSLRVQTVGVMLAAGQSIVQNGGFETGDFTAWTLVGHTIVGNLVYNAVATDADFFPPADIVHAGNFGASLGESGFLATLTQTLPTASNQLYQLSFWLNNPASGSGQQFAARWNGNSVLLNRVSPPAFAWTNFQFLVTATGTNTQLRFYARNDPNYFGFDDVAVTPVPPVVFSTAAISGGNLQMSWNALAGLKYEVDYTTNLAPVNWQLLGNITAATNICGISDTGIGGDSQRFYRLLLVP
jgi:hypothetical protein